MRLHPSALIDNEEYIIEIKSVNNEIKHVYKGKRKVTSVDKINEEGLYDSLWFLDLDVIYINNYITLKPPKLKRSTNICYTDLQYSLVRQNGKEIKLCDTEDDDEEITFYDCDYYEKCVLPKLEKNMTIEVSKKDDDKLLSCV